MSGVITASEPTWIAPFTGLSPRSFGKLVTALRREGADPVRKGRPWSLPLEDRVAARGVVLENELDDATARSALRHLEVRGRPNHQ